ncbi:MAG: hypothetical protein H0W72_14510 [Planctomycetes bacterium]|nr:hypothetical protein [Planctomycetota bacterium]
MTYYIVPWAGMWHVYRSDDQEPAAALSGRDRAEHWCSADAAARGVAADIYHGEWISRRVPA